MPNFSPSLLLSFPLPVGFNISGKCAKLGFSQLKASYNCQCRASEGSHSSPLQHLKFPLDGHQLHWQGGR